MVEHRDFCLPHLHSTPPSVESQSEYCYNVSYVKTKTAVVKIIEDMSTRFDRIHERDRQTDEQIDRRIPHYGIGRTCA